MPSDARIGPSPILSLRALVLEDDPLDAELVAATLRQAGYSLTFTLAGSPGLLRERLGAGDYDIVLADYNLGNWTAMDALEILRDSGKDIPLVVVTGALGDEAAVECIKRGAADYVLKDRLERVPMAVDRALRRKAYSDAQARQQEEIRRAKEEWEQTFDAVSDPILLMDEHFRIKHANKSASALLGLELKDLLDKRCYEVLHGLAGPHPACPYRRLFTTGKAERSDIAETRLGRTFDAAASPFFDASGNVRGCVHVLRDITERKRAEESLRQLSTELLRAQDDERRRIARELHDSTGQHLAALGMNLAWVKEKAGCLDSQTNAILEESFEIVKRCTQEIRDFSYLLHPPTLDEYGLASAIRWYVESFARRSGIRVTLELPEDLRRLAHGEEIALFRVVQECLTNVHRHSGSPTARIRIMQDRKSLSLEVADEGHGFQTVRSETTDAGPWMGLGLLGMRERMSSLGGHLEIESDGHGTTVRAQLPLEEKAA